MNSTDREKLVHFYNFNQKKISTFRFSLSLWLNFHYTVIREIHITNYFTNQITNKSLKRFKDFQCLPVPAIYNHSDKINHRSSPMHGDWFESAAFLVLAT